MSIKEYLDVFIMTGSALSAVAGGLYWAYIKVYKPICTWGKKVSKTADIVEQMAPTWKQNSEKIKDLTAGMDITNATMEANTKKLEAICKELKFNGGFTLRDMVSDIHSRVMLTEQFDKALADSLPYAVWHSDKEGDYIWTNRMWEHLTGISKERAAGKGWILAVHEDDRDAVVEEWYAASEEQRDFVMKFRYVNEEGNATTVYAQAFTLKDDNGNFMGHIGTATPVTEV